MLILMTHTSFSQYCQIYLSDELFPHKFNCCRAQFLLIVQQTNVQPRHQLFYFVTNLPEAI